MKDGGSSDKFVDAGDGYYKCTQAGEFDMYAKFIGDDQGIWATMHVEPQMVTYKFALPSWVNDNEPVLMGWVWGEGQTSHWVLLEIEQGEPGEFVAYLNILDCYTGIKLVRFLPDSTKIPDPDSEEADFDSLVLNVDYWNMTGDVALPGSDQTININF